MRVARQAPASITSCLVFELKAKGQDEGEDTFDKRLAVAKERKISRLVLKINGDSPVFAGLAGLFLHGSPSGHQVCAVYDTTWGNPLTISRAWRRTEARHH
jgi:hypothetical protein